MYRTAGYSPEQTTQLLYQSVGVPYTQAMTCQLTPPPVPRTSPDSIAYPYTQFVPQIQQLHIPQLEVPQFYNWPNRLLTRTITIGIPNDKQPVINQLCAIVKNLRSMQNQPDQINQYVLNAVHNPQYVPPQPPIIPDNIIPMPPMAAVLTTHISAPAETNVPIYAVPV
jgi:hypothetical protein